jgi:hypothetical protein
MEIESGKKNTILHPLHCLYKFALLGCSDLGTKLSIYNYTVSLQDNWLLQGIVRSGWDTREDIALLYTPIVKAMKWYFIEDDPEYLSEMTEDTRRSLYEIAFYSLYGIKRLINTYNTGSKLNLVCLTLQLYYNTISNVLDENKLDNKNILRLSMIEQEGGNRVDLDKRPELTISDKIKRYYNDVNIKQLRELFNDIYADKIKSNSLGSGAGAAVAAAAGANAEHFDKSSNESSPRDSPTKELYSSSPKKQIDLKAYIRCVESILKSEDDEFRKIMYGINTNI